MFIGHFYYGVAVGAVEVDEPEFWDYSCGLGLDGLQVALAEPAVDGVIGVAGNDAVLSSPNNSLAVPGACLYILEGGGHHEAGAGGVSEPSGCTL